MTERILASLGRLRFLTVALLIAAIVAGIVLPVYTDEVGWRLQERAALDGLDKGYADMCGPNTLVAPPTFMMPVRLYSALFNGLFPAPLAVRLSGVLYALIFALLLFLLIRRLATGTWRAMLTIVAFGLLGLGIMPLLLVWSRPEQPILLVTTATLLILFWRPESKPDAVGEWLRPFAILILGLIALSYHFKALLLIPAFLGAMWFVGRGRAWPPRIVPILLLIAAAYKAKVYWFGRFACPGDPILSAQHAKESLGLQLQAILHSRGPIGAALLLLRNLDLTIYARLAAPTADPMSEWLAPDRIGPTAETAWIMVVATAWLIGILIALRSLIVVGTRDLRGRRIDPRLVMALLLLAAAAGWSVFQIVHNVYEASFELPLILLASLLALSADAEQAKSEPMIGLTGLLAIAMPISMALVALIYGPSLWRATQARGSVAGQDFSVPMFHYAEDKAAILAAAKLCRIAPGKMPANLLIDDLTYFAFMQNARPQHYLAVLMPQSRGSISDPRAYLKSRDSGGIILRCRHLPPDLQRRAQRNGQFCCLNASDL